MADRKRVVPLNSKHEGTLRFGIAWAILTFKDAEEALQIRQ